MISNQVWVAAQGLRKEYPQLSQTNRWGRAMSIANRKQAISRAGNDFQVVGETGTYTVSVANKSCTCPDSEKGNICKHRIAVQLAIRAGLL